MFAAENIIRELARILKKTDFEISEMNLFSEGSVTHYNQTLFNCNIEKYVAYPPHCILSIVNLYQLLDAGKNACDSRISKSGI